MADTLTRRSVRSRTTHPLTESHTSTSSCNSSTKGEKISRSKVGSPTKNSPFDQSDDAIVLTIEEGLSTRRSRKRGKAEIGDMAGKARFGDSVNGVQEIADDDNEAVRCICGLDDYPGAPQTSDEDKRVHLTMEFITPEDVTEDLAGFFLQCDGCKVWQHGGCVGIKNETISPDEYFCEKCRKDKHLIFTAINGQTFSLYLPLQPNYVLPVSRATSSTKERTRSPKDLGRSQRNSSAQQSAKRRSTMNSRDAAYDEEEELRRAIEASKGIPVPESVDSSTRREKRGRSVSEDGQGDLKRQRTVSPQLSVQRESNADSEDDGKPTNGGNKKIRGAAARNHHAKEARDEKERLRQEAANKRQGRAAKRQHDSEPPEEATTKSAEPAAPELHEPSPPSAPDTPPAAIEKVSISHKKGAGGRPPNTKKGKVGRNQYTRDKDNPLDGSPRRSRSQDGDERGHETRRGNADHRSRGRGSGERRLTFLDMRRKVAAMLDYISQTQLEMANEPAGTIESPRLNENMRGLAGAILPMIKEGDDGDVNGIFKGISDVDENADGNTNDTVDSIRKFEDMGLLEMMEVLSRSLIKWQQAHQ